MPWHKTNPMNERVRFISSYLEGEEPFVELCELFGISPKTGYKWLKRYESEGVEGMVERSRAPHAHPNAVAPNLVMEILKARNKHPRWGPRKLLVILQRQYPELVFPATSTIGEILRRNGLIVGRRKRRRSSPYGERLRSYDSPNSVWCADFKGHFPVNGKYCYPLTISDGYSRYLLACTAQSSPRHAPTRRAFERVFREFGIPDAIRTDNGSPFSSLAAGGLSRLAVWWIRLGIHPERIMPGRPDQNGRHERMHETLKAETARPPRTNFRNQQKAFDLFRYEYNEVRPHEALGQEVPASLYQPSNRPYPSRVPEPEYPDHFHIARAYPNGVISFGGVQWYLTPVLAGELVGLEPLPDHRWKFFFGTIPLGIADLQNVKKRQCRNFGRLVPTEQDPRGWHRTERHYMKKPKKMLPMCPV